MCEQEAAGMGAQESLFYSSVSWIPTAFSTETVCAWGNVRSLGPCRLVFKSWLFFSFCVWPWAQLTNLSDPRFPFMKTRDLISSEVVGRIKWDYVKNTYHGANAYWLFNKSNSPPSLLLSPDFNALLSTCNTVLSQCQLQLVKVVKVSSAKRKHTKPRMCSSALSSEIKTWFYLLVCAWRNSSLLFSLLSHPLVSSLTLFSLLALHQWPLLKNIQVTLLCPCLKPLDIFLQDSAQVWPPQETFGTMTPCTSHTFAIICVHVSSDQDRGLSKGSFPILCPQHLSQHPIFSVCCENHLNTGSANLIDLRL